MLPTDESFGSYLFVCFSAAATKKERKNINCHFSLFGCQITAACCSPGNNQLVLKDSNIQPVFRSLFFIPDFTGAASNNWHFCLDGVINLAVVVDASVTSICSWLISVIPTVCCFRFGSIAAHFSLSEVRSYLCRALFKHYGHDVLTNVCFYVLSQNDERIFLLMEAILLLWG